MQVHGASGPAEGVPAGRCGEGHPGGAEQAVGPGGLQLGVQRHAQLPGLADLPAVEPAERRAPGPGTCGEGEDSWTQYCARGSESGGC